MNKYKFLFDLFQKRLVKFTSQQLLLSLILNFVISNASIANTIRFLVN